MIEVKNLSKSYGGTQAISNLNFSVQKGEVVGFLGPNGAGKSTTMKIITGFMAPTEGQAIVAGFDVFENPLEVKRRIGYLPETPPVYGDMKVKDYLRYVAELKGVDRQKISHAVDSSIEKTHLQSVAHRYIQNLSKGFKQRVGIAQALVSDPEVLILDEPTVGLDPKQVAEIRELIQGLKGHHTLILSTHILPEVQMTCGRIIIIHQGQIVAQDSLENLSQLQSGNRKIYLRVRKSLPRGAETLKIEGVLNARELVSNEWEIDCRDQEDLVEKVALKVIESGSGLVEISSVRADLEDIFLKLTYGQDKNISQEVQP
jgi:ABC-2 type transport system ATP-binding protein